MNHNVKTLASGEYSCSCGAIFDRDEGPECPAYKPSAELPGMWEPSDLSGGETDQSANPHVIQYAEGIFVWFDEVGLPGGVETSAAAAHTALGEYARSLDAMPTGCTFCGSDEHMTAVCPMRADERAAFEALYAPLLPPFKWHPGIEVFAPEYVNTLWVGWQARAELSAKPKPAGCGAKLAAGQYFSFCGETDMGQSLPALCDQCGGGFKLDCP